MMLTEKLYDIDSHLFEFSAVVLSSEKALHPEKGDSYATVLDRTAFFPEGGGQSGDTGKIGDAEIFDTQIRDGIIYHYSDKMISEGEEVSCVINKEIRLRRMQNHSGEHLVSGLIYRYFGFDNVGFHMGHEDITLDTSGILSCEDIERIEYLANKAIAENVPINSFYPDADTLKTLEYRSKKELEGDIRIVKIEGYDACACCAPHVKCTGEIGLIKLLDFEKNKGGMRIHMLCGLDALDDYKKRFFMMSDIARAFSVKQNDVPLVFERMKEEISGLKDKNYHLRKELLEYKTASLEPTNENLCIFEEGLAANDMRSLMNKALPKCGGVCIVLSGSDEMGYTFTAAGHNIKMTDLAASIRSTFNAKCGGNDEMIQGSIKETEKTIKVYFGVE